MLGRIVLIVGLLIAGAYGVLAFRAQKLLTPTETLRTVLSTETTSLIKNKTVGITMFRGNGTRTFYGTGPVPTDPVILWQYPKEKPVCSYSTVQGDRKLWCGNGWTGQPVVWERPDGVTEVIVGMYDGAIHFLNADTGEDTRSPFQTGDIIKGSVTLDPDGYPLLYSGSRDNFYRIIALDREIPTELWRIEAKVSDGLWNNDWDGNGLIEDDILYEGSENGIFHIIKLNRSYDSFGKVIVSPKVLTSITTFSEELIGATGDTNVSIESSPLKIGSTVYIANSGGRIMGFDVSQVEQGITETVFDFWTGDDTDATLIADTEGFIYAASQEERFTARSQTLGQVLKLDPRKKENPVVWGLKVPGKNNLLGGVWATPALGFGYLYVPTNTGELLTIDTSTGGVTNTTSLGYHAWSSPNIIDKTLIVGTCEGSLQAYSLTTPHTPVLAWDLPIKNKGCIESTPAIWNGAIYLGTREGFFFKVGQK
jgi:hypothetical protein